MSEPSCNPIGDGPAPPEFTAPQAASESWSAVVAGFFIVLAFALVNLVVPQAFHQRSEMLTGIAAGICLGEVELIGTLAALGTWNVVVRLPWSFLLLTIMWASLVQGSRAVRGPSPRDIVGAAVFLCVGATVPQIPLWIARHGFRWRLTRATDLPSAPEAAWQFHIGHLFGATFLLSAALAVVRLILPLEAVNFPAREFAIAALPATAIASVNLVVATPAVWYGLALSLPIYSVMAIGVAHCLVVALVEFFGLVLFFGAPPGDAAEIVGLLCVVNGIQFLTLVGVLWLYRVLGYRLVRVPRRTGPVG